MKVGTRPEWTSLGLEAVAPLWYRPPRDDEEFLVRFRYSHPGVKCRVGAKRPRFAGRVFAQEQGAVAPGQLAVFYRARKIVGSAWINKANTTSRDRDIMKLSTRGRYGVRAMLELAINAGKGPVPLRDLAAAPGNFPAKYLEQLLIPLKGAGLVKSVRGARGGYSTFQRPGQHLPV